MFELVTFGSGLPPYRREVEFRVDPGLFCELEAVAQARQLEEGETAVAVLFLEGRPVAEGRSLALGDGYAEVISVVGA